jgi:hypothetical protein
MIPRLGGVLSIGVFDVLQIKVATIHPDRSPHPAAKPLRPTRNIRRSRTIVLRRTGVPIILAPRRNGNADRPLCPKRGGPIILAPSRKSKACNAVALETAISGSASARALLLPDRAAGNRQDFSHCEANEKSRLDEAIRCGMGERGAANGLGEPVQSGWRRWASIFGEKCRIGIALEA